jgi:dienelactone hydrolase
VRENVASLLNSYGIYALTFLALCASAAKGAERAKTEVQGQEFVADFYCEEGCTNKLGILYLGGSEGGKPPRYVPELFAQNGYPVLAPAYFKEQGLPDTLQMIPLEYFDKVIAWMERNERIPRGGIVAVGASKGAELALLLASRKPEIKGVIALSPSSVVWDGLPKEFWPPNPRSSWSVKGEPVPFVPYDYSKGFAAGDPLAIYRFYQQSLTQTDAVEWAAIKVEYIHGPVLLLSGRNDQLWPSEEMGDAICARLKKNGFKYRYEHVKYDNAGHTLSEYYLLGGTLEGNRKARIDSARRMLEFLKTVEESISAKK